MCDMTHSCLHQRDEAQTNTEQRATPIHMWHDPFMSQSYVKRLFQMWHDSFMCHLTLSCSHQQDEAQTTTEQRATHIHTWLDWLIHVAFICDRTLSMWHVSSIRDMSYSYWHDSFMFAPTRWSADEHRAACNARSYMTCLIHVTFICDMTHSSAITEKIVCASSRYGMATISRLLKIISLFCRISSLL